MEFFGIMAFVLVICYSSLPTKLNNLEAKLKKLERNFKGEKSMSKILSELINKKCILVSDEGLTFVSKREIECNVLAVDDEWIKFEFTDKKGIIKIQIFRIESIERVEFIEN